MNFPVEAMAGEGVRMQALCPLAVGSIPAGCVLCERSQPRTNHLPCIATSAMSAACPYVCTVVFTACCHQTCQKSIPGTFAALFQEDAHMPGIAVQGGPAAMVKAVAKVRVDALAVAGIPPCGLDG